MPMRDDSVLCSQMASACSSQAAVGDVDVWSFQVHATAGMLSHQILTDLCFNELIGSMFSSTMNSGRMPASSKLEMDIEPLGLSSEISFWPL